MIRFQCISRRVKYSQISDDGFEHFKDLFSSFPIHSVHLLIPNSNHLFSNNYEKELLSDRNTYFIVKDVPVTSLIQNTFLELFVKTGLLLGTSHTARIESENFLSIIPPGKLVLSLEREIAKTVGLHKEFLHKRKKRKRLFETIIIDMTNPEFFPGSKHYKLIYSELSKIDEIKFNLLLKWEPQGNVCPQSMKSYFSSQGIKCVACKPKYRYAHKKSVPVPKISYDISDTDVVETFLEWIGMQICGIKYCTDEDDYACKLSVPESSESLKSLCNHSFVGFYSKTDILSIIKVLSTVFENDSSLPFIVLCVSGYQDSYVVTSGIQEFSSEDKQIYLIIFPSSKYLVITLNAS